MTADSRTRIGVHLSEELRLHPEAACFTAGGRA